MSLSIVNNMTSLHSQSSFGATVERLNKSIGKLSTGLRINSSADDPSGLAISERMRTQIRGLARASANATDGISMLQMAEGALNETHSILQRMRELAVQAANGALTANDRMEIQKEIDQLKQEVDRISDSTEFNTKKLLDGKGAGLWSSSNSDTQAIIVGQVDQGNYRLAIDNTPGVNEIKKTDIFRYRNEMQSAQVFSAGGSVTGSVTGPGTTHISSVLSTKNMITAPLGNTASSSSMNSMYQVTLENAAGIRSKVELVGSYVDGGSAAQDGVDVKTIAFSTATGSTSGVVTAHYLQVEVLEATTAVTTNSISLRWSNDQGATWNVANTSGGVANLMSAAGSHRGILLTLTGQVTSGDRYLFSLTRSAAASWGNATGINTVDLRTNMQDINKYSTARAVEGVNTNYSGQQTIVGIGDAGTGTLVDHYKASVLTVVGSTGTAALTVPTTVSARAAVVDVYDSDGGMSTVGFTGVTVANDIGNVTALSSRQGNIYVTVVNSALVTWHSDADHTERLAAFTANNTAIVISNTATIFSAGGATFTITMNAGASAEASSGYKFVLNYHGSAGDTIANSGNATALVRISGANSSNYRETVVFNTNTRKDSSFYTWGSITGITSGSANLTLLRNNGSASGSAGYAGLFAVGGVDSAIGTFSKGSVELQFNKNSLVTGSATFEVAGNVALRLVQSAYQTSTQIGYTIGTLDAKTGDFNFGTFDLSYGAQFSAGTAKFNIDHATGIAHGSTQLREIDKFYDANGVFTLGYPGKTITLYNGKGDSADIFLSPGDTVKEVADKIQKAIVKDLGMTSGNGEVDKNLVTFVDTPTSSGDEAVKGTIVIRSPWQGANGRLMFSGPEDVLNALSLMTIQEPIDLSQNLGQMDITVTDAHTGILVGETSTTDGIMRNLIGGVEVALDPNIDVQASWDGESKEIVFSSIAGTTERFVHVTDNSMNLQIGANDGQTTNVFIAQMDTQALGVKGMLVTDQTMAENAISLSDEAIQRVSSERARIGANINRLQSTLNNLAVQEENMTAAESSVRDLNVAKEISKMTQLQMLQQVDSAMIAQANQLPQSVLALLK